jgi:FMN reductase
MASEQPFLIGLGGSPRAGSTSERLVARTLSIAEGWGARTQLFDGPFVAGLPLFNPFTPERTDDERRFVEAVRRCDGIVVSTPGYHGSLSGPIKNALDLIEDTARDPSPYLADRAFGAIVVAHGWQATGTTLVALRSIAHALRAWPIPFGAAFNASTPLFEEDGSVCDPKTDEQLTLVARQVFAFARVRHEIA